MSSFLDKVYNAKTGKYEDRGMYNPLKRYGFKNITDEAFTFSWNDNPITVPPGVEIELPEHLAITATHKLVDQIMQKEIHAEEEKMRRETRDAYWKSPRGISMAVPTARKPYESKVLRELQIDERSPQFQVLRSQIKEQILGDLANGQKAPDPLADLVAATIPMGSTSAPKEFSEIPGK